MKNILKLTCLLALMLSSFTLLHAQQRTRQRTQQRTQQRTHQGQQQNQNVITISVKGVSFKMVRVQGGTFTMGATAEQGGDADGDEKPAHKVTLSNYYIGETEVTQELWAAVMGSNPSEFKPKKSDASCGSYDCFVSDAKKLNAKKAGTVRIPTRAEWDAAMVKTDGSLRRPVDNVSWDDCQEFIRKLNQLTGKTFRLPTEAEWEFAARGGTKSRHYKFAGGNTLGSVAWYDKNAYDKGESSPDFGTHPVARKAANELGLYDMSGNVWERCQDRWGDYSSSAQTNPKGPSSASNRVYRGGGWISFSRGCRVSNRDFSSPGGRDGYLGLRLAL